MSMITPTQPIESRNLSEWIPSPLFRMSLERYEAMVESGLFTKRDRLHLINGILVAKVTQGDEHCEADDLCRVALEGVLPPGWYVRSNKPVRLPPDGALNLTRLWFGVRSGITGDGSVGSQGQATSA